MPDQSSPNCASVTVYIYEPEFDYLKWLVLQKREIETGGDLFGLWQDEGTAVVQFILGPGKGCRRTTTSFHQDVDYLEEVGGYLTSSQGLCNIGEWHSHHTLGLAEPSYGDQQTVWNHISSVAGGRFLVFIANIRGAPPKVNVGCFLFNWNNQTMLRGNIKCLRPCPSPVRLAVGNPSITSNAELAQDWRTFMKYQTSIQKNNKPVVDSSSPRDGHGISHKLSTKNDDRDRNGNPKARNGNPNARIKGSANTGNRDPSTINVLSNSPKNGNGISNISSTGNGSHGSRNSDINERNGKASTNNVNPSAPNAEGHTSNDDNGISNITSTGNSSHGSRNGDKNERNGKANTKNVNRSTPNAEGHTSNDDNGISNIPRTRNGNRNVGDGETNTRNTSSNARNENSNIKNSKPSKKNNQLNTSKTTSKARKSKSNKKKPRQRKRVRHEQKQQLLADDCEEEELSKYNR